MQSKETCLIKLLVALVSTVLACACGSAMTLEEAKSQTPSFEDTVGAVTSQIKKDNLKPWIAEWDQNDRAELEAQSKRELAVVAYDGRELELLTRCHLRGTYAFSLSSPQSDSIHIDSENRLYAEMPLGPVGLLGEIRAGKALTFTSKIIGTRRSNVEMVSASDLSGDCEGATHFVFGMSVGAYSVSSEGAEKVGVGVDVKIVETGASSSKSARIVSSSGDMDACEVPEDSNEPPLKCNGILRLHLVEIATSPEDISVARHSILPFAPGIYNVHVDSTVLDSNIDWDVGNGIPDPYVIVSTKPMKTWDDFNSAYGRIITTHFARDTYTAQFGGSQEVEFSGSETLYFLVIDEDAFSDDWVGTCQIQGALYEQPFQNNMLTVNSCDPPIQEITIKITHGE